MQLTASTATKLDHTKHMLAKEFWRIPYEEIGRTVDSIADELATRARFADYIPILVLRRARDELRGLHHERPLPLAA